MPTPPPGLLAPAPAPAPTPPLPLAPPLPLPLPLPSAPELARQGGMAAPAEAITRPEPETCTGSWHDGASSCAESWSQAMLTAQAPAGTTSVARTALASASGGVVAGSAGAQPTAPPSAAVGAVDAAAASAAAPAESPGLLPLLVAPPTGLRAPAHPLSMAASRRWYMSASSTARRKGSSSGGAEDTERRSTRSGRRRRLRSRGTAVPRGTFTPVVVIPTSNAAASGLFETRKRSYANAKPP